MEAETYQRALHLWPKWDESILNSRQALGYDPTWPVAEAVTWIQEKYVEEIQPRARTELVRLELPANLQPYWEDCFYCDYLRPDGSADVNKIRRRVAYEEVDGRGKKTGRWLQGNRSLPAMPFDAALVWYEDEDVHDPRLRIEVKVHAPLVSRDILDSALDQAWRTITHTGGYSLDGSLGVGKHPLLALIPQARVNRSETKRRALERYQRGEVGFEGLLAEAWLDTSLQQELREMVGQYRGNPVLLRKEHRYMQKRIYDRVRNWFPYPKPRVVIKGQWREHMPLPESKENPEHPS